MDEKIIIASIIILSLILFYYILRPPEEEIPSTPDIYEVEKIKDIEYANVGGKSLLLDLYLPKTYEGKIPVLLLVHGGGWEKGTKEDYEGGGQGGMGNKFASEGFAVVAINYRLSYEATFPAQIFDVKASVRWIRAHSDEYGLDPDGICAMGSSAGGHLVSLLGTSGGISKLEGTVGENLDYSSNILCVVDLYGPADLTTSSSDFENDPNIDTQVENRPDLEMLGCSEECPEKASIASPITYVSSDDPPFLILHGGMDRSVHLSQSQRFHKALSDAGVDSKLLIAEGVGHNIGVQRQYLPEILSFLNEHLK